MRPVDRIRSLTPGQHRRQAESFLAMAVSRTGETALVPAVVALVHETMAARPPFFAAELKGAEVEPGPVVDGEGHKYTHAPPGAYVALKNALGMPPESAPSWSDLFDRAKANCTETARVKRQGVDENVPQMQGPPCQYCGRAHGVLGHRQPLMGDDRQHARPRHAED